LIPVIIEWSYFGIHMGSKYDISSY